MTGKKRTKAGVESFGITVPTGLYREMIGIIEKEERWDGRVDFVREAIREKLDRIRLQRSPLHPGVVPAAASARAT